VWIRSAYVLLHNMDCNDFLILWTVNSNFYWYALVRNHPCASLMHCQGDMRHRCGHPRLFLAFIHWSWQQPHLHQNVNSDLPQIIRLTYIACHCNTCSPAPI
jgi:hypothetical protein